jgi:transposase-like protein
MTIVREFVCSDCGSHWQARFLVNRSGSCPQCGGTKIQKVAQGKGFARLRKGSSKDVGRRWIR